MPSTYLGSLILRIFYDDKLSVSERFLDIYYFYNSDVNTHDAMIHIFIRVSKVFR